MIEAELAKYGGWGIAVGALILVGGIVKYMTDQSTVEMKCQREQFLKFTEEVMRENSQREKELMQAISKNTKVTDQVYELLKNLNGELRKTVEKRLNDTR